MFKNILASPKKIVVLLLSVLIYSTANSQAPQQPSNINPVNGTTNYAGSTVTVTVTDPNGDPMTVKLYGRKKTCTSTAPNFTIVGLPDTQFYTEELPGTNSGGGGSNAIFKAQTQWIANHRLDSNMAFVVQLGDCVQNGDTPPGADDQIEWKRADTSIKNIEFPNVPVTDGIPYGICVGNHDQSVNGSPTSATKYYNQYFGSARFAGRGYYGGQFGANSDNHYELFSSGGIDFIHISIEYYPDANAGSLLTLQPILDWADALLKAYPARKGIVSSHQIIGTGNPASFQGPGQKMYDDLKDNPNLFLMLCGHVPGEGRRSDTYNGNTVYTILSDYQNGYTNGGNGYLRIMEFSPAQGIMDVKTYSPYSNTSFTTGTSQFTIPVTFQCPFTLMGTNTSVSSGSSTTLTWLGGLQLSTDYEWYVTISDGVNTTTSSVSGFRTWNGSAPVSTGSLRFTDTTYINLGNAPELKLTNFTLEAWVKIEGYASTTQTGTGVTGLLNVVPIISKGRDEGDGIPAKDINYFLGYQPGVPGTSLNKLVADFEDGFSINHPVISTATIPMNTWTHVGASYDVTTKTWRLFIGAAVESTVLSGGPFTPQSASTVSACIGSTLNIAGGVRAGSFNGRIDEARIWNTALSTLDPGEVSSGVGLAGRWGFGDASGTILTNSIGGGVNGTIANNNEWVTGFNDVDPTTNASIDFNGAHDYVSFGPAPTLNTTASATGFTLEGWVKVEGAGVTTSTGSLGLGTGVIPAAIPIIAKGAAESDAPSNLNMNYFLGLTSSNFLAADFEEATGASTGLNHPVIGTTAITNNVWTHVAVTYNISDGAYNFYANGMLAGTGNAGAGKVPEFSSIQHASVGTTLTSGGTPSGFFNGKIDEVRIWKRALSQAEIQANMNNEITSGTGLLGRWGFNENGDSTANNSIALAANGILRSNNPYTHATNGATAWVSSGFVPVATVITTTTAATPPSIVYGTSSVSLTTTLSPNPGGGTVQFYVDGIAVGSAVSINTGTGAATLATYNPSSLSAGSHIIRGDFSGFGSYAASTGANGTLTITQKPLTITGLTASNKIYDGTLASALAGTATLNGVLAADASNVILGGSPAATFATTGVATGKPVTVSGYTISGSASGNYSLTQPSGLTANITAKSLTALIIGTISKVYDGTTTATLVAGNYSLPGVIAPDVVTLNNPASGTYATKNVGTSIAITVSGLTISGSGSGNYVLSSTSVSANTGSITAKSLTAGLTGTVTKVYDGTTNATLAGGNYTLTGVVNPDVVTLNNPTSGTYSTKNAGTSINVTVPGLTISGAGAGNYVLSSTSVNANIGTITALLLNYTSTKVYDGTPTFLAAQITITNIIAPDVVPLSGNADVTGSGAGSYNSSFAVNNLTTTNANYASVGAGTRNFTITPKPITVTATAGQSKIYGAANPVYTYTSSPALIGSDAFTGALSRVAGESISNYAITQGTLTLSSNYTITFVSNNFAITNKTITVTVTAGQTKVYGSADPAFVYTYSPALTSPDAFTGALSRAPGENVGSYAVTQGTLTPGPNYTVIFASNNFVITPKSLALTATAQTRIYGDPDPVFTGSINGFITGETQATATTGTLVFTTSAAITSNAGSYAINGSGLTANNGNYTFVQAGINATALSITQRPLDFSGARIFDGTATFSSAQLTTGNVVNSDVLTIAGSATVSSPNVGIYSSFITNSLTTSNSNYKTVGGIINVSIINVPLTNHKSLRVTDTSYVDLGNASSLHLTSFTVEAWIKIEGYSSTTSSGATGSGGGQDGLVPIITKGRAEQELASVDVNYFLSYRLSDRKLVADFEDNATSLNHSVTSAATLPMNTWVHVGASFDQASQKWRLFIDNNPAEIFTLTGGPFTPQSLSNVDACIGSTLNSAGGIRQGFFNGRIDEVRIWNTALTSLNQGEQTTTPGNLVGRWGFDEGIGNLITNTVVGGPSGSAINKTEWVSGFNVADSTTDASIRFNGVHDYVSFGAAPTLNTTAFTLEAWIYKEGAGITTNTGTGGVDGVPIIAKGRAEAETPANLNMNYFLGINSSSQLVADFEESTGPNHPVTGIGSIPNNVWTHVAATYDPTTGVWNLYINGTLDKTLSIGANINPVNTSIQHASIGSAINSTGVADGFFNGKIDEVRIWNKALSISNLQPNTCPSVNYTTASGLLGRWGFNENGDVTALNSKTGGANGILISNNIATHPTNGGPSWACNTTGEYRSKNATGTWSVTTDWEIFNGTNWIAASKPPMYTDNVTISSGSTYTVLGAVSCNNLTVNSGGKLFRNSSSPRYVTVYGHIICNGIIGNGSTPDGISFNIEGDTCSISGSGIFDGGRIRKECNGQTKTNLTFNRSVNLRYDGTALFNDVSSTYFNIKIAPGVTINCMGDGTANSAGSVSIDGTNGADVGYNAGSLTVNGTLNLTGNGTSTPTLYLTNSNANVSWPVSVKIDSTGTINTGIINCSASGAAGHSFTMMSGGKLNITGEPASYIAPSLTNNNYTLNSGSTIEYSKSGNQTVYTFGTINYSNLFGSGSGTKTILVPLSVADTIKLTGISTLSSSGNLTLLSSATKTARIAELPVNGSGIALANITGDVTVERYISAKRAWRFLSVPTNTTQTFRQGWQENQAPLAVGAIGYGTQVTNIVNPTPANGFDYYSAAGPSVKKYDITATGPYAPYVSIANTFAVMKTNEGIMTFVRGDRTAVGLYATPTPTILRTKGPLYTGNQPPMPVAAGAFASIGNPYASPLDMKSISKTNTKEFFYLWDPKLGSPTAFGAFQTFYKDSTGGTGNYYPVPGTGSYGPSTTPQSYIQSGQAFFVAGGSSAGTVTITESAKATPAAAGNALVFRPATANQTTARINTNLYAIEPDASLNLVDGTLNQFADMYSNAIDRFDAVKITNFAENLAIKTDGQLLVVERKQSILRDDTIHLNMLKMKVKSYRFEFIGQNFAPGLTGFLEDSYYNTRIPLNINATTTYDFNVINVPGSWNPDRFRIVFATAAASVLPVTFTSVKAYPKDNDIAVDWKVEDERNIKAYEVERSADGQHFSRTGTVEATGNNGSSVSYQWPDIHPLAGSNYYRIKSIGISGEVIYSNIVKVVTGSSKAQLMVYPNPVSDGNINLQLINQPKGSYGIRLMNKLGQVIMVKQIDHLDGSSTEHLSVKLLAHGAYNLEVTLPDNTQTNINVLY